MMRKALILFAAAGALAALGPAAPASAVWPFGSGGVPDPRAPLPEAAAQLLSASIRIPTVNPPGDERPLAELLQRFLRRAGIPSRVIATPPGRSRVGRAALWARLRGRGDKPALVLLSHLDVVPADRAEWAFDPYAGSITGGFVVGRGALDAKGVAVVHLLTLVELARRDAPLDRDVILLATPDEEAGGRHGAGWLATRHPELVGGAGYLLTEGGGILSEPGPRPDVWGVTVTEKAPCWMRATARGAPGHASTAGADGAVPRLVGALDRVRRMEPKLRVVPDVARMFAALAPLASPEDRAGFAALGPALASDAEFRERFLADPARAALVRNTLAITVLRAGTRINVVPAEARAELDARLLPGERCERFLAAVRDTAADPAVAVEPLLSFETRASPVGTPLFHAIERVAAEQDPRAVVIPRVIAGFTDAHYFRDLGLVAYGFVPRWLPPGETRGVHGPNERISIENLVRGVRTLARIVETLDAAEPSPAPR